MAHVLELEFDEVLVALEVLDHLGERGPPHVRRGPENSLEQEFVLFSLRV